MAKGNLRFRNLTLLFGIVLAWLALDRFTKAAVENGHSVGDVLIDNLLGFRIELVHNTGAAWGAFSDATGSISIVSIIVLVIIVVYSIWQSDKASVFEMIALALLGAGGIGNLIDRLNQGYVTDFITPTFIEFPTFNVADIGVTFGVIMLIVSIIAQFVFMNQAQKVLEDVESNSKKANKNTPGRAKNTQSKKGSKK